MSGAALVGIGSHVEGSPENQSGAERRPDSPTSAWAELVAGNERFLTGHQRPGLDGTGVRAHAAVQEPYAVVLGCFDSRVPPELIFDQGFGQICVLRSGGHVLDRALAGSLEFAVTMVGVPLIVVLGHQFCAAVQAAVTAVRSGDEPDGAVGYLVDRIAPAVRAGGDADQVARRHTLATMAEIAELPGVAAALAAGRVAIVGARYDIETARVERLA